MAEALLDDLVMIVPPRTLAGGPDHLIRFGLTVYNAEFPGVTCSHPESCPYRAYGGNSRSFSPVPGKIARRAQNLWRQGRCNIPVGEFDRLFGPRVPSPENPSGFRFEPGAKAGDVSLFFFAEPVYDVIWPAWAAAPIVSERVKNLLVAASVTGVIFHHVDKSVMVEHFPLHEFNCGSRSGLGTFRRALVKARGIATNTRYYELQAAPPPADCGMRYRLSCPHCGYTVHDCTNARTRGPLISHNGNDFFDLIGLGRPVCTTRVVDVLRAGGAEVFEVRSVAAMLDQLVAEYGTSVEGGPGEDQKPLTAPE